MKSLTLWTSCIIGAAAAAGCEAGRAQLYTAVSPAGLDDVEGNTLFFPVNSPYPSFPDNPPLADGWRAQELHCASAFDALGPGPFRITGLAWRPDGSVNEPTSAEWEVRLNLSTTNVNTLSTRFADNIGAEGVTEVFSGTLQLGSDGVPQGGGRPHEFEYLVEFQTPFLYDPREGNLLVEMVFSTPFTDQWIWVDADDGTGEFIFALSADAEEALPLRPGAPPYPRPGLFVTEFKGIPQPSGTFTRLGVDLRDVPSGFISSR